MKPVAFHADCGEMLDEHGACPKCGLSPDMQSTELRETRGLRVAAARDVHRQFGSPIEAGRLGTVLCGVDPGLVEVQWDDDFRSMAVDTASLRLAKAADDRDIPWSTIHIVWGGKSFCDISTKYGVPRDWPRLHAWVTPDQLKELSSAQRTRMCAACTLKHDANHGRRVPPIEIAIGPERRVVPQTGGKWCGHKRTATRRDYDTHERCLDCGAERARHAPDWGMWVDAEWLDPKPPVPVEQGGVAQQIEPLSDEEFSLARATLRDLGPGMDAHTHLARLCATVERVTRERDGVRWRLDLIAHIMSCTSRSELASAVYDAAARDPVLKGHGVPPIRVPGPGRGRE